MSIVAPAYAPCIHFETACKLLPWAPDKGYIPRGFLGATGTLEEVRLVLVFSEPGDPHEEKPETFESSLAHTYKCMRDGEDRFHDNVRKILKLCFPNEPFDSQLRKTWMTESLLCSASKECGAVPAVAWRTCSASYLKPQLNLLSHALVVALGWKAHERIKSIGISHMCAAAAAPPGCNFMRAKESWKAVADALHRHNAMFEQ